MADQTAFVTLKTSVAWLIVWLPLIGFLFCAFAGKLFGKEAKWGVARIAPVAILMAFGVSLFVLFRELIPAQQAYGPNTRLLASMIPFVPPGTPWIKFGGFEVNFGLLIDPLSMLMALIVTGVGGLIHVYATGYMAEDPEQPRFFTYFNLFIFMMLLLVLGENFLLMFVGWEGVGTCSYLLISFWHKQTENAKAGNKAFIVNRVGDLGFALGMMLIWSVFGTLSFFTQNSTGVLDLARIKQDVSGAGSVLDPGTITLICVLLFIGAVGKSAQIPLHVWLPDAMAGPTPVSALIHAATMVTAGVVMVTRCSWLFVQSPTALQIVGWIGILTAFMGATIGLVQNDIKRVLAYSTISQLGYMFLACGVGNFTAAMFHVTTHAFFKALLFLGSGAVIHSMLGEQDMRKMGGLRKYIPRTWAVMFIGTYAIAGFPLLSGFWSKDEILHSAAASPWGQGTLLWGIGIVTALMTAFYMNRLMWKTFYVDPQFVDGQIPHQHHSNFDEHDAQGHEEAGHEPAGGHGHDMPAHAHGHEAGQGGSQIHESPPSMMIPLYILALLSIGFGAAMGPTHLFARFLEPSIAPLSLGGQEAHHGWLTEQMGYILSSLVAFAGLGGAWYAYSRHRVTGKLIPEEAKMRSPLYLFLMNKWGFDAFYNRLFIQFGGEVAEKVLWKGIDRTVIDGTVNALAGGVGLLSRAGRRLQTGFVRNYALAMLIGVVILITGMFVTYQKVLLK